MCIRDRRRVISDFRRRGFPREFHVLRDTGNDRSRENIAIFTNPCAIQDNGVRIYMAIITDYDIFLNHGKRIDSYILADLGLWMNDCLLYTSRCV